MIGQRTPLSNRLLDRLWTSVTLTLVMLVAWSPNGWGQDQDTSAEGGPLPDQKPGSPACLTLGYPYEERDTEIKFGHLQKALEPYGICVTGLPLPFNRHVVLMQESVIDGDVARVWGLHKMVPGVIRIPTPLTRLKQLLVAQKGAMISLDDFETIRLVVVANSVHPDGSILLSSYETVDRVYRAPAQIITVQDQKDLPDLLQRGRVDAILTWETSLQHLLDLEDYDSFEIYETGIYTYLIAKQAAYLPIFDKAIKAYKAAGNSFNEPFQDDP